MRRLTLRALSGLSVLLLTLFIVGPAPAVAAGVDEANHGYTEDSDTNDNNTPNNVSDEGDNQQSSGKDRSVENGGSANQGASQSNPDDSKGPMRCEGTCGEPDKANGAGGTDKADQDANNGCGNDDDFDDDNNGWCGKPTPDSNAQTSTCPAGSAMPANGVCGSSAHVPCDEDGDMSAGQEKKCDESSTPLDEAVSVIVWRLEPGTVKPSSNKGDGDFPSIAEERGVLPAVVYQRGAPDSILGERFSALPGSSSMLSDRIKAAAEELAATLPFTGGNVITMIALALALVAIGALALRARHAS